MRTINSTSLIARREKLETELQNVRNAAEERMEANNDESEFVAEEEFADYDKLEELRRVCREGEAKCAYWDVGEALIPEDEFAEHAEAYAEGLHDLPCEWPFNYIDWYKAAEDLKSDYVSITLEGQKYLVRVS